MTSQRLAGLEREARQPRLATEADVKPDTKTGKHTEDASSADRMKNGERSFAKVDYGPTSLTSFGMITELKGPEKVIGDALVNKDAEALNPHISLMEVRMLLFTAGGLLLTGTVSTIMRAIFPAFLGASVKRREDQPDKL